MSDNLSNDNTDKTSNTPDDQFSLNHFESNDDADAFQHLIQEDGQQEPIVPADFDDAGYDMDDMDGDQIEANALFDDGDFDNNTDAADYFEATDEGQANAGLSNAGLSHAEQTEDDGEADAESKPWLMFVVVAVVVLGIVAWLNMGEDESNEIVPVTELTMPPVVHLDSLQGLPVDQRQSDAENTLRHVQQRLSVMEERFATQKSQTGNMKPASIAHETVDVQAKLGSVKEPMQPTTHAVQFAKAEKPLRSSRKQVKQAVGWVVVIASVNSRAAAIKHVDQLKAKAIEAAIYPTSVNGNAMYRIGVGGFASHDEAAAQKKYLVHKLGVKGAWLYKAE